MSNLLSIVATVLIIAWLMGFAVFHVGGLIHILIILAIIAFLLRIIQGRRAI